MATVNLLPWRDALRQEKKKEFFTVLVGFCILGALCSFIWVSSVQGWIDNQNSRNSLLTKEIADLKDKVKEIAELDKRKQELVARMDVINKLEGTRTLIVRYVDDLVRAVPDGVFFASVARAGDSFTIKGYAESQPRVADLLRSIDESDWFKDASPTYSRASEGNGKYGEGLFEFEIKLKADAPKKDGEGS